MFQGVWIVSTGTMSLSSLDATPDRTVTNSLFNDEVQRRNGMTSYFQTNIDLIYSIKIIVSLFGDEEENA